jgi:hypothetical protein
MSTDRIRIITRGDDIGSFRSANRAALYAADNGILRNFSLLATGPFIEEAARLCASRTDICFGVHLTVTSEWTSTKWGPVLPPEQVPSLLDENGHLVTAPQRIHDRGTVFSEIMAECRAQVEKVRSLGFKVDYVDTHMGFGWLFEGDDESVHVGDLINEWAETEGIISNSALKLDRGPKPEGDFSDAAEAFLAKLKLMDTPGTYLAVGHPVFDDEEMKNAVLRGEKGNQAENRDAQRRMFTDLRILEIMKEKNIEPIFYSEA